jgi:hypothetical protein
MDRIINIFPEVSVVFWACPRWIGVALSATTPHTSHQRPFVAGFSLQSLTQDVASLKNNPFVLELLLRKNFGFGSSSSRVVWH